MQMKEALPEVLSTIVYKRFLVYYIRQVQQWMNTKLGYHVFGSDYRPSETEEAVRCIFTRAELLRAVEASAAYAWALKFVRLDNYNMWFFR